MMRIGTAVRKTLLSESVKARRTRSRRFAGRAAMVDMALVI